MIYLGKTTQPASKLKINQHRSISIDGKPNFTQVKKSPLKT
jgi:hypothetical protein